MTISQRDKRALLALGVAAAAFGLYTLSVRSTESGGNTPAYTPETIQIAEQRLAAKRQLAESVPQRETAVDNVRAQLKKREAGLIQAATAAQAQAQLLQVMRRIGSKQQPPLDIRGQELGQVRPYGDAYGQVTVTVSFECQINQLIDLLSDLGSQPELVASQDLRVGQAKPREKLSVALTVAGLVPRKLVPEKKAQQGVLY